MAEAPQGVMFTKAGARRIVDATRLVEKRFRNPEPTRARTPAEAGYLRHAQTTSTITARSGATVGTGSAALYHLEGSTLTADDPAITITVKSSFATAIASGKWIIVSFMDGEWFMIAADC